MSHFDHDPGLGHLPDDHAGPDHGANPHPAEPAAPVFMPHDDDLSAAVMSQAASAHGAVGATGALGLAAEYGDPGQYHNYWFYQGNNETCAPASVTQVIEAQTGINLHGEALVQHELAELHMPSGNLTMEQAQTLLNHFSIPSHLQDYPNNPNAALSQLEQYLHDGRNVVLSVNASPIWYGSETADNDHAAEGLPSDEWADHAVVVTAINTQTGMVTLSDTGNPGGDPYLSGHDGNEEQVPISVFLDAWQGSNYEMLVTDHADGGAPQHAAIEAVQAASGAPASPGEIISQTTSTSDVPLVVAGCVLLALTLGVRRIAKSGKFQARGGTPGARPATA
jgi:hypothetical protein